jgi:hypothetical protein
MPNDSSYVKTKDKMPKKKPEWTLNILVIVPCQEFFLNSSCHVLYYKVILTETILKIMGELFYSLSFKFLKAASVKIDKRSQLKFMLFQS